MTNEQIQDLLDIPKVITKRSPATGCKEENNQKRCEVELEALSDENVKFSVFVRQNSKFSENFSVGLRYRTNIKSLGSITLIRYNGAHGEYSQNPDGHYALPHIHRITEQDLASGSTNPQESKREITGRYHTLEQALRVFFEDVGVANHLQYFPDLIQPRLFDEYQ